MAEEKGRGLAFKIYIRRNRVKRGEEEKALYLVVGTCIYVYIYLLCYRRPVFKSTTSAVSSERKREGGFLAFDASIRYTTRECHAVNSALRCGKTEYQFLPFVAGGINE